jgi:acyl-CoA reductase-like NAD-dependent aldehyde dehydrogenase
MSNKLLDVTNPSTGELITTLNCDSQHDIENKLFISSKLYRSYSSGLPKAKRIEVLEQLIKQMQSNQQELAELIASEGGKPLKDALVEVSRATFSVKQAIAYLLTNAPSATSLNNYSEETHYKMQTSSEPIGPVVAVSAFNHPLNLVTHQIISAFAAGCPCIIKPAVETPLSCLKLIEMLENANIPEGWVQAVITDDIQLAEQLVTDPRVAFFSFIGSAKVGWYLRSQLSPGTRCALEHGGVAPAFVDKTADINKAVESLVKGAFYHAGQVCVSTQRIYIERCIFDEFSKKFTDKVKQLKVGDALNADTDVGPLIREQEITRISKWILEAYQMGASVLTGGDRIEGQFFEPTVLTNVPENATINKFEVFGPVCNLIPYDNLPAVIDKINDESFSFHSAIFSNSIDNINFVYQKLQTGCLMINEHTAFRHDAMPFAGLKESGLGVGGMPHSIHHMQIEKMMITKY